MRYTYLLLDLPSDHEVESVLATECDSIRGILANQFKDPKVKHVRATTLKGLQRTVPRSPYPHVKYVHLACHGDENSIGLIGANLSWSRLAKHIVRYIPPLEGDNQRVLCLSCCYSAAGAKKMKLALKRHFTAVYYLTESKVGFDTSMVVWSMFYYRKPLEAPLRKVIDRINAFFGDNHNLLQILYCDEAVKARLEAKARLAARRKRLPAR